jgi:two-component system response regulator YesN
MVLKEETMIKLLIVDDEIFTREGIIEQISWSKLGIDQIEEAFDGINALEIADSYSPDILLTDVRMPRMDGIELSYKLRELFPDCEVIFMSGYSDKEYLKAAIKLKAISYVEKPIDLDELEIALKNAVSSKSKELQLKESFKTNIAADIIRKNINFDRIREFLGDKQFTLLNNTDFITLIISTNNELNVNKVTLLHELDNIISRNNLTSFSYFKEDDGQILFHLYPNFDKNPLLKKADVDQLCLETSQHLNQYGKFFICVGSQVNGVQNVLTSYEDALEAFNKTFFYNYGSIIYKSPERAETYKFDETVIQNLSKYLSLEDKHQCIILIKRLTAEIKNYPHTPINYVKDIYYRLFTQLIKFSSEINISLPGSSVGNESLFESFIIFSNIFDLEEHAIGKIEELFKMLEEKNKNIDPITSIMRYIHENYDDIDLSLPDISKNTYLSPTYICKIFKDQTGTTINKYIAEYRLNKAKELLKDNNITINDIAAQVGYGDGNYFTKIFKKETGLTPSEFRKKFLL